MSLLIVLVLIGASYMLLESGMTFFALVVFLVALLQALTQGRSAAVGHATTASGKPRPIIVTSSGGKIPSTIKIAAKHNWDGSDGYSDFLTYLGGVVEWPFRVAVRIFTGKFKAAGSH